MTEIQLGGFAFECFRKECDQSDDIGLLYDLRFVRALSSKYHVQRRRAARISGEINLLQAVEPFELLVQSRLPVESRDEPGNSIAPIGEFASIESEFRRELRGALRPTYTKYLHCFQGPRDIPSRHHIRERVVVHILVVLVGSDDVTDVPLSVRLALCPRRPEARGLKKDPRTCVEQELIVAGDAPILPDGIGDVGADVLFELAEEDVA